MPLRFVQVGMGGWGRDWAKAVIPTVKTVIPVARVDADQTALETAKTELDLPDEQCFTSLSAALAATNADAVLITAQLGGHVPIALEAIAAGKHVLVEKPFAASVAEARRVVEAADKCGVTLMVSQNYRHFPAPRAVAEMIAKGELGPVGSIYVDFRRNVTGVPGREKHFALANPLLADMAIHHFDLMRLILGKEPQLVSCQTWNPPWSPFVDPASGVATIVFDGGAVVSWRGSWVSPGEPTIWGGEWRVECSEGEIRWTSRGELGTTEFDCVSVHKTGKPARELKLKPVPAHGRAGTLTAFAKALQSGTQPETSGRDNLGTLAIVEATIASSAAGKVVPVKLG
jgi:predicted dehydrogenase